MPEEQEYKPLKYTMTLRDSDGYEYALSCVLQHPAKGVKPDTRNLLDRLGRALAKTAILCLENKVPVEIRMAGVDPLTMLAKDGQLTPYLLNRQDPVSLAYRVGGVFKKP